MSNRRKDNANSIEETTDKDKSALSRRCTLLLAQGVQAKDYSLIRTRDLLNKAFRAKGIKKPVVSTATLFIRGNIVVNTTPEFNLDFLIQHKDIIKGVLPLVINL